MVDTGLWFIAEAHLDAGVFSLPFGSSYLNSVQFIAAVAAMARRDVSISRSISHLSINASVCNFTATCVFRSIQEACLCNKDIDGFLADHLHNVRDQFEKTLSFKEYLDRNELMWKEYHHMLSVLRGDIINTQQCLPWLFRELESVVRLELASKESVR